MCVFFFPTFFNITTPTTRSIDYQPRAIVVPFPSTQRYRTRHSASMNVELAQVVVIASTITRAPSVRVDHSLLVGGYKEGTTKFLARPAMSEYMIALIFTSKYCVTVSTNTFDDSIIDSCRQMYTLAGLGVFDRGGGAR